MKTQLTALSQGALPRPPVKIQRFLIVQVHMFFLSNRTHWFDCDSAFRFEFVYWFPFRLPSKGK